VVSGLEITDIEAESRGRRAFTPTESNAPIGRSINRYLDVGTVLYALGGRYLRDVLSHVWCFDDLLPGFVRLTKVIIMQV